MKTNKDLSPVVLLALTALLFLAVAYQNHRQQQLALHAEPAPPSPASLPVPGSSSQDFENARAVQLPEHLLDRPDQIPATTIRNAPPLPLHAVVPPVPAIPVPSQTAVIDAKSGGSLEGERGSSVYFPPNAFVDHKGKPVTGAVDVKFTTYLDPTDIFLSGIPMTYKANGKNGQFESAGMMQLTASADGKAVYANPQSPVKVWLAARDKRKNYNLYYFDPRKGAWTERGKDQVTYKKKTLLRTKRKVTIAAFPRPITNVSIVSFEGVPKDKVFLWWTRPSNSFQFRFTNRASSKKEVRQLSGMSWEYRGENAREVYSKLFRVADPKDINAFRKVCWQYARAEYDSLNSAVNITFGNEDEEITIAVRPKEKSEHNMMLARKKAAAYDVVAQQTRMEEDQRYLAYVNDSIRLENASETETPLELDAMRSFTIDEFGIWNVDRVIEDAAYTAYRIRLTDEAGQPLPCSKVFLADKNYNTVFAYCVDKDGYAVVYLNPFSQNMLWAVLPDNRLAVAGQNRISQLPGSTIRQLPCMIKPDVLASIEQMREELNF